MRQKLCDVNLINREPNTFLVPLSPKASGAILWSKVVDLFKKHHRGRGQQQHDQDASILVDALTLVNKTLAHIKNLRRNAAGNQTNESKTKYQDYINQATLSETLLVDSLGMASLGDKCSDLDDELQRQFRIYEKTFGNPTTREEDNDQVNNNLSKQQPTMEQANGESDNTISINSRLKLATEQPLTGAISAGKHQQQQLQQQDDDNYESANEESPAKRGHKEQKPATKIIIGVKQKSAHDVEDDNDDDEEEEEDEGDDDEEEEEEEHKGEQCRVKSKQTQQRHLLQPGRYQRREDLANHKRNGEDPPKQNLARGGKQQRASISSCSSSDSYASYGSGYASGSGNSTDHEHKQRLRGIEAANGNDVAGGASNSSKPAASHQEANVDYNDEDGIQLRQHLSELEKLTNDLASSRIFCTSVNQAPAQVTSKYFASTANNKSTNSPLPPENASDSTSSRLSTQQLFTSSPQQQVISQANQNAVSRSASATPTSNDQQKPALPSSSPHHLRQQQRTNINLLKTDTSGNNDESNYHSKQPLKQHQPAPIATSTPTKQEPYFHNLFQWEQLVSKGVTRPLLINDLDFTDLRDEDDCDLLNNSNNQPRGRNAATGEPLTFNIAAAQQHMQAKLNHESGVESGPSTGSSIDVNDSPGTPASAPPPMPPPPMSPWFNTFSGSRPQSQFISSPSPTGYDDPANNAHHNQSSGEFNRDQSPAGSTYSNYSRNSVCAPTQLNTSMPNHNHFNTLQPASGLRSASSMSSLLFGNNGKFGNKRKKTMKLFWKEVREDRSLLAKLTRKKTIWDEIKPVQLDTSRLEYLFESKAKDLPLSKSRNGLDGSNQRKNRITVLDAKRSNAINIGMTKLPPMRVIKNAILKMDSSIMNREGIEKILTTMMPTEEEKSRIIEAQLANPDTPLGTAEQFLLNLASTSALEARLKLWAFQLDYAQIEKEVAEPLMDLKQAINEIEKSETFRIILGTLLTIGNFLNSTDAKGFQIDYLEKVPEVKDTVHKHSLLHHLCFFIQENYDPDLTSDLYSEFIAVNRASKIDYTEVAKNLKKMQQDCKASWDYLKIVAKHDGLANSMNTCGSSSSSSDHHVSANHHHGQAKSSGKLNNLSKLSMITTVMESEVHNDGQHQQTPTSKQLKTKVNDFLTDCAERIMVLMVIHRRVMNRFQKLLVYLGCPSNQIKQIQPQQTLKVINEFALEYRTKRERVREMLMKKHQCQHHHHQLGSHNRWQLNRARWSESQQSIDSLGSYNRACGNRPCSTLSLCGTPSSSANNSVCNDPLCNDIPSSSVSSVNRKSRHSSIEPNQNNQQQHQPHHHHHYHHANKSNCSDVRSMSPSGYSHVSNYGDSLFEHSCCNSRQESITPVPFGSGNGSGSSGKNNGRLNSMSVSMFDLQNQQGGSIGSPGSSIGHRRQSDCNGHCGHSDEVDGIDDEIKQARARDEQMRKLLGAGKSLDSTCNDLYKMGHWSTTMTRVTRHPPRGGGNKQRSGSIDSSAAQANDYDSSMRSQSSYYKNLSHSDSVDDSPNLTAGSEDQQQYKVHRDGLLQSLVRATNSLNNGLHNIAGSKNDSSITGGNGTARLSSGGDASNGSPASIKVAGRKLLNGSCVSARN